MIIHFVVHFQRVRSDQIPNMQRNNGKMIGIFRTEAQALVGIGQVAGLEGFVDHPQGFRIFTFEADRDHWTQGFKPGPNGDDLAIAGDGTAIFGNDEAVLHNMDDEDRFNGRSGFGDMSDEAHFDPTQDLWMLEHYKISHLNSQCFEDMGQKLVGFYANRAKVEAAIARLRPQAGFSAWPDGFRATRPRLGVVHWDSGFVTG